MFIFGGMNLKVELLSYTPEPEKLVATAAKLCYSNSGITELRDGLTPEQLHAGTHKNTRLHTIPHRKTKPG